MGPHESSTYADQLRQRRRILTLCDKGNTEGHNQSCGGQTPAAKVGKYATEWCQVVRTGFRRDEGQGLLERGNLRAAAVQLKLQVGYMGR